MLFDALTDPSDAIAVRVGDDALTYRELRDAATAVADRVAGAERVAVWADISAHTVVGVVGALLAGVPAVPLNPKAGERELEHILGDSAPELILAAPGADVPAELPRHDVDLRAAGGDVPPEPGRRPGGARRLHVRHDRPAEGRRAAAPRDRHEPRRARRCLGLDRATTSLVHALPLFHVHGLVLGMLGPLRRGGGGSPRRPLLARGESPPRSTRGGTMLFGVPTMYRRLADAPRPTRRSRARWPGAAARLRLGRAARASSTRGSSGSPGSRSSSATA